MRRAPPGLSARVWFRRQARSFFFQAEDGIRDRNVTGVQTCALPILARGEVDLANWPNQIYQVESRVNFPRMRQIFWKNESWRLAGDGEFNGSFALFKGDRKSVV